MSVVRGGRSERGSATVETALVLPVIVGLILVVIAAAVAGSQLIAVTEGARAAARAVAIGEGPEAAVRAAARVCACRAKIDSDDGQWVRVSVTGTSPLIGWLPGFALTATMQVPAEPGAP